MRGLYKCNLKVSAYNIQSILIMHESDVAHISILYIYNSFYIRPFALFKMKIWASIQCHKILVTCVKSCYKSSSIGKVYLPTLAQVCCFYKDIYICIRLYPQMAWSYNKATFSLKMFMTRTDFYLVQVNWFKFEYSATEEKYDCCHKKRFCYHINNTRSD